MQYQIVVVSIILATASTGCSNGEPNRHIDEWRSFSDSQGKFSVDMPGSPERSEYDMATPTGSMKFIFNSVDMPERAKFFMVCFVDYPPELLDEGEDEAFAYEVIDRYVAGGARKKNLTVQRKSKIKLGNHPGQEYLFEEPDYGDNSLWRVYLVGDRLYQLVATWAAKEGDSSEDAKKFLNSFKLKE